MGQVASNFGSALRDLKDVPVFVVSLDALGTLYRFREPVSVQYLKAARRCGLTANIKPQDLDDSFRATFKRYNQAYPNYGKGKLQDPEKWWIGLINDAFADARGAHGPVQIPPNLGPTLYQHFSSEAAYELCPDTVPFLDSMQSLKKQYSDPEGPLICVGVITNSDPRVRLILESLGFRVGISEIPQTARILRRISQDASSRSPIHSPWFDCYDSRNDFDFLATSYDAGSEKPDRGIWRYAEGFIEYIAPTRAEKASINSPDKVQFSGPDYMAQKREFMRQHRDEISKTIWEQFRISTGKVGWVHIGDELKKDYEGARGFGHDALHLERSGDKPVAEDVHTISSLEEAAMVVNVMAQAHFKANS